VDDDEVCTRAVPKAGVLPGHRWQTSPKWGVIIGASRCLNCGQVAAEKHFATSLPAEPGQPGNGVKREPGTEGGK